MRFEPGIADRSGAVGLCFCMALGLGGLACGADAPPAPREAWIDGPVPEWPDFVLTNDISFADTTYRGFANAFLVDTGSDTVGVTCKHIFLAFQRSQGLTNIDLGEGFRDWRFRSSRDPDRVVATTRLVNADANEPIGSFENLKDRDWLIFELADVPPGIHPLRIGRTRLEADEVVYAVGRSLTRRDARDPTVYGLQHFQTAGTYHYVRPLHHRDPEHTSGSPVIDADGYLVGLVSGGVGSLGVVAGVDYLIEQLERHGIAHDARP
jgi:hypothetical protein